MKKANSKKLLVALLVLNLSGTYTPSAHAGTFDSLKEKAAKLLEKSKEVGSKALEKGKEITVVIADYANEKLEESRDRYDDLQNGKTTGTQTNSSQSNEVLEDLPQDSKISLNDSKNSNNANTEKTNSNNSQIISSGSSEIKTEEGQAESEGKHLGTISEKNPNPSQNQNKINASQEKKVGLFPWENEAPKFQENTQNTVYNSLYSFSGTASEDIQWIWIKLKHQDSEKAKDYFAKVENGQYEGTLHLSSGPGNYEVTFLQTRDSNKIASYYKIKDLQINNLDTRDLSFLQPSEKVQSDNDQIIDLAKEIVAGSKSQREAVVRINRWLMNNVDYDMDGLKDGSYARKDQTALGTLENRKVVCEGFANLFAALARASGIRTKLIFGHGITTLGGGPHAWNQVYIEGQWLNIDSTWDQNTNRETYIFMLDQHFNRTHTNAQIQEY